jgi:hypothetical protein
MLLGPGTAVAAPGTAAPVAPTVSSDGGGGGEMCAQLPVGLQEVLCPSAGDEQTSGSAGGAATSDTGSSSAATGSTGSTGSSSATTGGTAATTPPAGTSGSSAPAPAPGVVSNFLIWLAGLFAYLGL